MKRPEINSLTGVRGIAAWWVVTYHLRDSLADLFPLLRGFIHFIADPGYLGVDLFFLLSGFVIAYNYWEGFAEFSFSEYRKFLWMRLARLYPVHLVSLCATGVLFLLIRLFHVSIKNDISSWNSATFIQNLLLIHHWTPSAKLCWNYPAWSISCEWLAYLAFPVLVVMLKRELGKWWLLIVPALVVVQCATVQAHGGNDLIRIATEFTAGVILFRIHAAARSSRFLISVAAALLFSTLTLHRLIGTSDVWAILAFPPFVYGITSDNFVSRLLSRPWVLYWGRVSYSLYMFHSVAAMLLGKLLPLAHGVNAPLTYRLGLVAVWIVAIGAIASFSYAFVEVSGRRRMRAWMGSRSGLAAAQHHLQSNTQALSEATFAASSAPSVAVSIPASGSAYTYSRAND